MITLIVAAALILAVLVGFVAVVVGIHRADRAMSTNVRARLTGCVDRGVSWT